MDFAKVNKTIIFSVCFLLSMPQCFSENIPATDEFTPLQKEMNITTKENFGKLFNVLKLETGQLLIVPKEKTIKRFSRKSSGFSILKDHLKDYASAMGKVVWFVYHPNNPLNDMFVIIEPYEETLSELNYE